MLANMKADMQLDYAIFQLTPTRTRCELHVVAKGLTYKLASGLLKPFVSHLTAAEEQLARGGYSIRLEPPDTSKASWFTKGTMERFVRFVSTPEVLERVSSVEVELLELEETTRQQAIDSCEADNIISKSAPSQHSAGGKSITLAGLEKASKASLDVGENGAEANSKQRLLRALDARRVVLQKEQGMAFARALAAGFNLENMDDLVLFAECFGAIRLREACNKFLALCRKRQEAGLGLEDLELMAAANVQADMSYIHAMAGNAVWSDVHARELDQLHSPNEGKTPTIEDGTEKLTRRGSGDEYWQNGPSSRSANGSGVMGDGNGVEFMDAEGRRGPGIVKGHPMMATWQEQPQNQYMPGIHGHSPYVPLHASMPNHYEPPYGFVGPAHPGQPGLPYPHYLGSPYMPPPYPEGNGWQAHHSSLPPQFWHGHQANDPKDGSFPLPQQQQVISTPLSREKNAQEMFKHVGDAMDNDMEETISEVSAERTQRPVRRLASPQRRSASPMRKVQIGRNGSSKRSGMVVIRNINYITSKAHQQDNRGEDSEISGSWSEDGDSCEETTHTVRNSIDDMVGTVESKNQSSKDGKRRQSKNVRKKASAVPRRENATSENDAELDDEDHLHEDLKTVEKEKIAHNRNALPEDGLFLALANQARQQGSYDPALGTLQAENHGGTVKKDTFMVDDPIFLSQRDRLNNRTTPPYSLDMSEQEHQESKKMPGVDDSYIISKSRSTAIAWGSASMEPDLDFSSRVNDESLANKRLSDDSFIVLDRSAAREAGNVDWRMSLNLESERPCDQDPDVVDSAEGPGSFEPDDLFMVPDRSQDTYKRSWNAHLDYDMQVLAADIIDNGQHNSEQEVVEEGSVVVETALSEQDGGKMSKEFSSKVSEKDAKARAMKDMLERRRSAAGSRPGRTNPLAEAQLRAEKLRVYKAGLQKSKKEKEEEERKRIEDLRNQRQQRIAARTNGCPSSPSAVRRSPLPNASKPSPKVPNRLLSSGSPLSPSVIRDRVATVSRVSRPALASPKFGENAVSRSVSSLMEPHRESRKMSSGLRASTGSQLPSQTVRNGELNIKSKTNGHSEEKGGRARGSHTVEKVGRTDSGHMERKIALTENGCVDVKLGRMESGLQGEKLGRTESRRVDQKLDRAGNRCTEEKVESGRIVEKAQPAPVKTVKRGALQDGLVLPTKSSRGLLPDSNPAKKVSTVSPKPPAQRSALAPSVVEQSIGSLQQREDSKVNKPEGPVKAMEHEEASCVLGRDGASNSSSVAIEPPALPATETCTPSVEETVHGNGLFLPNATVMVYEEPKEDASHVGSSLHAESIAVSEDRQLEIDASSLVGEDYHAPLAHSSSSQENSTSYLEEELQGTDVQSFYELPRSQLTGFYSPPFAPPSEYALSPSANLPHLSPSGQQGFSPEANLTETSSTRSRKKWGDSKAKGLKRLLLLGRKSGRSSSSQNALDVPSEGEEEDLPSSNVKNLSLKFTQDLGSFSEQAIGSARQTDVGSGSVSSKGSRSIFSLSTFRGKSTIKV